HLGWVPIPPNLSVCVLVHKLIGDNRGRRAVRLAACSGHGLAEGGKNGVFGVAYHAAGGVDFAAGSEPRPEGGRYSSTKPGVGVNPGLPWRHVKANCRRGEGD